MSTQAENLYSVDRSVHNDAELASAPIMIGTTSFPPDLNIRNILITGGAGFIASWVTRHLTLTYPTAYNIFVYDKLDYCATLNNLQCLTTCPNYRFVYGDITDQQAVLRCLRQHKIDTILHFAAMSHVDLSFGNSFEFTRVNTMGTHIMLESAVKMRIGKFIHVSTDEVNGETHQDDPDLLEDSILAPTNPYAASKAAAEMLVNAYAKSFKLPCIIVRSNNVYGPNQYPESEFSVSFDCVKKVMQETYTNAAEMLEVIPKFASLLDRSLPLFLHGSGENTRRYLYASDAADAFDTILHKGIAGEIYNVDSADEVANVDLAHRMLRIFGLDKPKQNNADGTESQTQSKWIIHTRDRPFNDLRYAVNAAKLKGLGWQQKIRFEKGLARTVDWYRKFGRIWWGEDVDAVLRAFPEVKDGEVVGVGLPNTDPKPAEEVINDAAGEGQEDTTMEDAISPRHQSVRSQSVWWGENQVIHGNPGIGGGHGHMRSQSQPQMHGGNTFRSRSEGFSHLNKPSVVLGEKTNTVTNGNAMAAPGGKSLKSSINGTDASSDSRLANSGSNLGTGAVSGAKRPREESTKDAETIDHDDDDNDERENDVKRIHLDRIENAEAMTQGGYDVQ